MATFLEAKDLVICEQLNHDWKQMIESDFIWKELFHRTFPLTKTFSMSHPWKNHFYSTYTNPSERFTSAILKFTNALKNEPDERKKYLHYNSIIIRPFKQYDFLTLFIGKVYESLPEITPFSSLKLSDLGDSPMGLMHESFGHRSIVVQVYTDRKHSEKKLLLFCAMSKTGLNYRRPVADNYSIHKPLASVPLLDPSTKNINRFGLLTLVRTGKFEEGNDYMEVVNF